MSESTVALRVRFKPAPNNTSPIKQTIAPWLGGIVAPFVRLRSVMLPKCDKSTATGMDLQLRTRVRLYNMIEMRYLGYTQLANIPLAFTFHPVLVAERVRAIVKDCVAARSSMSPQQGQHSQRDTSYGKPAIVLQAPTPLAPSESGCGHRIESKQGRCSYRQHHSHTKTHHGDQSKGWRSRCSSPTSTELVLGKQLTKSRTFLNRHDPGHKVWTEQRVQTGQEAARSVEYIP